MSNALERARERSQYDSKSVSIDTADLRKLIALADALRFGGNFGACLAELLKLDNGT